VLDLRTFVVDKHTDEDNWVPEHVAAGNWHAVSFVICFIVESVSSVHSALVAGGYIICFGQWHGLFQKDEELEMTVRKWLRMQERDFFHAGVSKLLPTWCMCILCSENTLKNINTAME